MSNAASLAAAPPVRAAAAASSLAARHSPWIAAFLAFFPGLGAIYNGAYARGVALFLGVAGTMYLAQRGEELWGFAVAFMWLFGVVDAFREARFIRAGLADDLGVARYRPATSAAEGLGLGAVLVLIGLIAFLDLSLGLEVDWIFELWPVGLMLAGAWFITVAIRRSRARGLTMANMTGLDDALPQRERGVDDRLEDPSRPEPPASQDPGPPPHPPQGW